MNALNTIPHVKRLIGRKFNEPEVIELARFTALNMLPSDGNENIVFEWEFRKNGPFYRTEEIYAMILHKMKTIAEKCIEREVSGAVITVPSRFGHIQRQAVLDAGRIAGFEFIRLMNEPTAAALAFGMDNPSKVFKK
jgi:heat shock 70kDa protein 1/2/6/8